MLIKHLTGLALLPELVFGQIYAFEQVPVPKPKSLHTLHAFYVYSHADAPEKPLGQPFIKFHSLVAKSSSSSKRDSDSELQAYKGLQLTLLPYKDFWVRINPQRFCTSVADVQAKRAEEANVVSVSGQAPGESLDNLHVYTHTIGFPSSADPHPKDVEATIRATGVYVLVFSNCGPYADAEVSGSVVVKNSYGFLPGNEYHKLPFYGWLSVCYTLVAAMWMIQSLRWWRETYMMQNCITVVILLSLLEAFLWWLCYNNWNNTGYRGRAVFTASMLATVLKSIFSYMLVLVASLGWGVTRPFLDRRTILKVEAVSALYIVLGFVRESMLAVRNAHSLSPSFVIFCLLPVALLNGAIFYWIFEALSKLIETLKDRKQTEKLLLFTRLWRILVASLAIDSLCLLFQIFDLSRTITDRWRYQWFFIDGIPHLLFLLVLLAMMYLWAPGTTSKNYSYNAQAEGKSTANKDDEKSEKPSWGDEEGAPQEGDDNFWATTHSEQSRVLSSEGGTVSHVAPSTEKISGTKKVSIAD